jgi:hypothetical protein
MATNTIPKLDLIAGKIEQINGVTIATSSNAWYKAFVGTMGTHNGYIYVGDIARRHNSYQKIKDQDIHGGWTFSRQGWLGFDTLHAYSEPYMNEAWVKDELMRWQSGIPNCRGMRREKMSNTKEITQDEFYKEIVGHKMLSIDNGHGYILIKLDNGVSLLGKDEEECCGGVRFQLYSKGILDTVVTDYEITAGYCPRSKKITFFGSDKKVIAEIVEDATNEAGDHDCPAYFVKSAIKEQENE